MRHLIQTLLIMLSASPGQCYFGSNGTIDVRKASKAYERVVAYQYANVCDPVNAPITCLKFIQGKTAAPIQRDLSKHEPCNINSREISNVDFYCTKHKGDK